MNLSSIIKPGTRQLLITWFIAFVLAPFAGITQSDSTAASEGPELIAPSLDFITVQKGDNSIDLKASLRAKVNNNPLKLSLLKVTFIQVTDSAEKELGFVITDGQGVALYNLKNEAITTDKQGRLHLKAVFAGNKAMESAEGEVTIKRARIEMTPVKEDSVMSVQLKLVDLTNESDSSLAEVPLGLYVKRSFKPLKIGEGTTDETGSASIEVAEGLPGDPAGNLTLIGRLDESEVYGIVENSVVQKWGTPVSNAAQAQPRALWSTHPPTWMLVTFIILMTTVWGHYIVIIFELFRLRKEEPAVKD
jgi:hypothetical protein